MSKKIKIKLFYCFNKTSKRHAELTRFILRADNTEKIVSKKIKKNKIQNVFFQSCKERRKKKRLNKKSLRKHRK